MNKPVTVKLVALQPMQHDGKAIVPDDKLELPLAQARQAVDAAVAEPADSAAAKALGIEAAD